MRLAFRTAPTRRPAPYALCVRDSTLHRLQTDRCSARSTDMVTLGRNDSLIARSPLSSNEPLKPQASIRTFSRPLVAEWHGNVGGAGRRNRNGNDESDGSQESAGVAAVHPARVVVQRQRGSDAWTVERRSLSISGARPDTVQRLHIILRQKVSSQWRRVRDATEAGNAKYAQAEARPDHFSRIRATRAIRRVPGDARAAKARATPERPARILLLMGLISREAVAAFRENDLGLRNAARP